MMSVTSSTMKMVNRMPENIATGRRLVNAASQLGHFGVRHGFYAALPQRHR